MAYDFLNIAPPDLAVTELAVTELTAYRRVSLESLAGMRISASAVRDDALDAMIYNLRALVATQEFTAVTWEYPATWWDHTKRSVYGWRVRGRHVVPAWARDRWPVRVIIGRVEPKAYFPLVAVPEQQHVVRLWRFDGKARR